MPSTPANAMNLFAGAGSVIWDGTATISTNTQQQIYYISKAGSDSNIGTNINQAFLTFGTGITSTTAQTPSATNRFSLVCLDDGIYAESITVPSYVDVFAPNATLGDKSTGGSITCNDSSDITFGTLNVLTTATGIFKSSGSSYTNVDIDIINLAGSAKGLISLAGLVNLTWKQMFVATGSGIGDLSSATKHVHLKGGDIYVTGTGGVCIANASTGYIVGEVDHCLDQGGTGTAISITSGYIDIDISKIENATAYTLNGLTGTVKMNLFCNDISGSTSVTNGAVANVWTVPTYPANQAGMNNGQVVIGSTGANPVVANLTAGAGIAITNGSGSLSIAASSAGVSSINVQTFTSSGTYTPTSGMAYCQIEVVGGGGGGGGAGATSTNGASAGAGGGAGGYAKGVYSAATIGASQTITINSGGAGGLAGYNSGSTGGSVAVGSLISATGGAGGGGANILSNPGGASGVGSGGSVNTYQSPGGTTWLITTSVWAAALSGVGGSSIYGQGGIPGVYTGQVGGNALGYGSGGGGANNAASMSARAGGNGTNGIVIITEYITSTALTPAIPWTDITATSTTMAANNGYTSDSGASLCTLTLPTTAAYGTLIAVQGLNSGGWKIAQNSGQTIFLNGASSTAGTGGSLASTAQYNAVWLLCTTANNAFTVLSQQGILTLT